MNDNGKTMQPVSPHLWKRFWDMAAPYWRMEEKAKAWALLILLVVLLLAQTWFAVLFNDQTGEFTSALAARNADRFWHSIKLYLALLVGAVPIYAFYYYVRDNLGNHWRRWLTSRFLENYFKDRNFYELNADASIDNPDQRIAEDINTFTQRSLYFLLILIGSILQLIAFSSVLWFISIELVYFLAFYAVAGTLVTLLVYGKRLVSLNFLQLRREADFRFSLVRVRENAESIAFYRGEAQEQQQVKTRFNAAFDNFRLLIKNQFFLNLFQYAYSMLTIVLPSAIIASRVLSGELEVGRAVQAAGAFVAVLSAISVIIDNFESLSRFAAGIDRLDGFSRVLEEGPTGRARGASIIESAPGPQLALQCVTLLTPHHERILVRDLSVAIEPGKGLLIVGSSGSGKSSLLRAIAGLWYSGSGKIIRPAPEDMLFLPQQPYMLLGSLRKQLLYPNQDRQTSDTELLELLEQVNLPHLAERFGGLDAEMDWVKLLSIGEQQRLAFARVLLARPRFAILDEATSALDMANEQRLYQQLMATDTTPVSVGHRATILKFHHQVLELGGEGHWKTQSAMDYSFNA